MDQKRMEQIGKILFDHKDNQSLERERDGEAIAWAPELRPGNRTEAPDVSLDPREGIEGGFAIGGPVDKGYVPLKIRYVRPRSRSRGRDGDVFIQPVVGQPPGINPSGEIPLSLINTPEPGWEKWPFEPLTESERIARTLYDHEDSIRLMQEAKLKALMEKKAQSPARRIVKFDLNPNYRPQQALNPLANASGDGFSARSKTAGKSSLRNSGTRPGSSNNYGRSTRYGHSGRSDDDPLSDRSDFVGYEDAPKISKSYKDWLGGMLGGANGDAPSFEGGTVEQNSPDPDHDADRH